MGVYRLKRDFSGPAREGHLAFETTEFLPVVGHAVLICHCGHTIGGKVDKELLIVCAGENFILGSHLLIEEFASLAFIGHNFLCFGEFYLGLCLC